MKTIKIDKLQNLITKIGLGVWINKRREIEDKISQEQSMFCCCGKLATGLHESGCQKFQKKVNEETYKSFLL